MYQKRYLSKTVDILQNEFLNYCCVNNSTVFLDIIVQLLQFSINFKNKFEEVEAQQQLQQSK